VRGLSAESQQRNKMVMAVFKAVSHQKSWLRMSREDNDSEIPYWPILLTPL